MNRLLTALLVALSVALIGLVAVWLLRDDSGGISVTVGEPVIVSAGQLAEFDGESDTPVFWLGERGDSQYELTETSAGRIYVRYLEEGAEAGDPRADFITVATYPSQRAVAQLGRVEREQDGAKLARTKDGAVLLVDPSSPENAHLAYPGADFQIEVFSPVPGQALRLASRGAVRPVG